MSTLKPLVWIVYNDTSNPYKLDQFKKTKSPKKIKVEFVHSDSVKLSSHFNELKLPDFCISLIVDIQGNEYAFSVLQFLEANGVQLLNSLQSVDTASNKFIGSVLLTNAGYPTPATFLVQKDSISEVLQKNKHSFPFVIKPVHGRKSRGVSIIRSQDDLDLYLRNTQQNELLIQEFVEESFRTDLRVYVLGDQVLGALKRTAHARTFSEVTAQQVDISKDLEERSVKIAQLFGLQFCCVDYFLDKNNSICEVNSSPGFVKFESVLQKSLVSLIYNHVLSNLHFESE